MAFCCCWLASCNPSQKWGSSQTGRYKTDFNGLSIERLGEDAGRRQHDLGSAKMFGAVQLEADFAYDALQILSADGMEEQYRFWQSVFGSNLHGKLYYFSVRNAIALRSRPEIPVSNFLRLKTFFINLDVGAPERLAPELHLDGEELPDWFDASSLLCLRVPSAFADRVIKGQWAHIAVPDPALNSLFHAETRQRSRVFGWSHCPPCLSSGFQRPVFEAEDLNEPFTADSAYTVLRTIQDAAAQIAQLQPGTPQQAALLESCQRAAQLMRAFQDELDPVNLQQGMLEVRGRVTSGKLPYKAHFLIKCMLISYHLRDASDLRKVLKHAIEAVMPKRFAEPLIQQFSDPSKVRVPSATKQSRVRLSLDAAFMLHRRQVHKASMDDCVRYIMADSSVQGHHDFELIRCVTLCVSQSDEMFRCAQELHSLWRTDGLAEADALEADIQAAVAKERDLFSSISKGLLTHLFPSVVIGSGHASLYHKTHALAHAVWLETGDCLSMEAFFKTVLCFCTDQGVEASFSRVPLLAVRTLLPWAPLPENRQDEHDWAPAPDLAALHAAATIDMSGSVGVPGMLHIIHNSTVDFGHSMPRFSEVVNQLQHLCKFLRKRDTKQRLLESCFQDPVGRHLQAELKAFSAKLHTGRWGSIAECVRQVLEVETSLRFGWDLARYGNARPRQEGGSEHGVDLTIVDTAITSSFFWGYVHMLQSLTHIVQSALGWCESCVCHGSLPVNDRTKKLQQQWRACPLRACRAPELAAGGFMQLLRRLSSTSAGHLLASLPRDLHPPDRAALLSEFERGRSHLLFVLGLRLEHWRHPPWSVFGCGHIDPQISKDFLRRHLAIESSHSLIQELQEQQLAAQAQAYIDGDGQGDSSLARLPRLTRFMAKLLFCPVAERLVEGDHAQATVC